MERLQPPSALCLTGNLSENWRRFKQQFEIYMTATGIAEKENSIKSSTFLHVIGPESLEIYNTFTWATDGDNMKLDKIMEKFKAYCNPRKNLSYERHIFNTRNQQAGENIDAYVTDLKNKASLCEFSTLKDSLIRDRIVCGIRSDEVRARLLRDPDLTLVKAIDACPAAETSQTQLKGLTEEKPIDFVQKREILSLDRILQRMEQHNNPIDSSHARIRHNHTSVKDVDILMKKRNVLLLERNVETVQS